jgi:hypothetical protein
MATLRDVSINKLDQLTISFLHKADEYEDKDDKVVSTCDSVPDIKVYLPISHPLPLTYHERSYD